MSNAKFQIVSGDSYRVRDPQSAAKSHGLIEYPFGIRAFYVDTREVGEWKESSLPVVGLCAKLIWMRDYIKRFKSIDDWKALVFAVNQAILPSSIDEMFIFLDMDRRLCYIWWSQASPT